MSFSFADEEHLLVDAPVAVPECHSLYFAVGEVHLIVDTPVLVVKNSLLLATSSVSFS